MSVRRFIQPQLLGGKYDVNKDNVWYDIIGVTMNETELQNLIQPGINVAICK